MDGGNNVPVHAGLEVVTLVVGVGRVVEQGGGYVDNLQLGRVSTQCLS